MKFTATIAKVRTNARQGAIALALGATIAVAPVATGIGAVSATAAQSDILSKSEASKNTYRAELLTKVNSYRASKGLKPVKYSPTITKIAQDESNRIIAQEDNSHSLNYQRDARSGKPVNGGEINIVSNGPGVSTSVMVDVWKRSPGHNAFLLRSDIDVIGIGITEANYKGMPSNKPWGASSVIVGYDYGTGSGPSDTSTKVSGGGAATTAPAPKPVVKAPVGSTTSGYPVKGGIYTKWKSKSSTYGSPTTAERRSADGSVYQMFRNGSTVHRIVWKSGVGTFAIKESGAIGGQWKKAGYERGYGVPMTDERSIGGGVVQQKFKNGTKITSVNWKSGKGVWVVR